MFCTSHHSIRKYLRVNELLVSVQGRSAIFLVLDEPKLIFAAVHTALKEVTEKVSSGSFLVVIVTSSGDKI